MKTWAFLIGYLTELGGTGVSPDEGSVVSLIITISAGVSGVIATGLIVAGAIKMLTSAGEAGKIQEGQEMIVNALMGLALILLAVMVVRTLGVDILALPDFKV